MPPQPPSSSLPPAPLPLTTTGRRPIVNTNPLNFKSVEDDDEEDDDDEDDEDEEDDK